MMPRPRLLAACGAASLPFVLASFVPELEPVGLATILALALGALIDLWTTPSLRLIEVYRHTKEVLSVGARNPINITVRNRGKVAVTVEIHDEPPQPARWLDLPQVVHLASGRSTSLTYGLEPHRRGPSRFGRLFLRTVSRWGFWMLQEERPQPQEVKIYPDILAVRRVKLLARQNRLAEAGVRLSRLRGRGSEFDRLREYRREDEFRCIDWKATARHGELISREYVVERNQNLLLVLDAGHTMCNRHHGVSHFDRALNAAVMLSYVALRQGDTVGLLAGARQVERWVPPGRGRAGVERLIHQIYDLKPTTEATDYDLLVSELRRRHRKRSLVILLTYALDELHLQTVAESFRRLQSPHLLLIAFLRNVPLEERMRTIPTTHLEAFQIAAAAELATTQREGLRRLEQSGLLVVNCLPEELSERLISRYLDIKARHLL